MAVPPLELTVLANLFLSIIIVLLSIWGFIRIGKPTPLYFGFAYLLFASSHIFLLLDIKVYDGLLLVILRILGYLFVAIGLFAIISDIIQRKNVEKALRDSEERLSATFDQAAVGIAEILPDMRISRSNRKLTGILGYSSSELSTMSLLELITPEEQLNRFDQITQVISGNLLQNYSAEMRVQNKNNRYLWCQVFLSAVRDEIGENKYFILVLEDITARKCTEEELAQLNVSLEERIMERTADLICANESLGREVNNRKNAETCLKDTLTEKEVLLKEIHHRVKNNLQIIISLLYMEAQKTADPVSAKALSDSQSRIQSMALVHQKLYQSGDLASIDFEGYVNNLISHLMAAYGVDRSRITFNVHIKKFPLSIHSAIPLGLIMNELVSNALKYAFPGGRCGQITIMGEGNGEELVFIIHDNGVGMPEKKDGELKDSLGLNLVRMLTRQMKGKIHFSSINGTEFHISIPVEERRSSS
ncbi:MAG: histidine kinase dimerization/phosphoacceptor domain -containing protein [Methanoregula sp.]|nr:histidine kinase dimerization/phosphoacceptor domain -containing protein [Methanoregula sp.]